MRIASQAILSTLLVGLLWSASQPAAAETVASNAIYRPGQDAVAVTPVRYRRGAYYRPYGRAYYGYRPYRGYYRGPRVYRPYVYPYRAYRPYYYGYRTYPYVYGGYYGYRWPANYGFRW